MKNFIKLLFVLVIIGIIFGIVKHVLLDESDCPEIDDDIDEDIEEEQEEE